MQNRNERSFLNIDCYSEDDLLYVRFDLFTNTTLSLENLHASAIDYIKKNTDNTFDNKVLKQLLNVIPDTEKTKFLTAKKDSSTISVVAPVQDSTFKHEKIIYTLSTDSRLFICWCACFAAFMNEKKAFFNYIQFKGSSLFENLPERVDIHQFFNFRGVDLPVDILLRKISEHRTNHDLYYKDAFNVFNEIHSYYKNTRDHFNKKTFIHCISFKRYDLLLNDQFAKLANENINKEKLILEVAKDMYEKKEEFLFLIDLLHSQSKKKFLASCLGKIAQDNHPYSEEHTEVELLYYGDFVLSASGNLCINLEENSAYKKYYALGKMNHAILDDELKYLANILSLEFEPDCHFHRDLKIIFTLSCSQKLIEQGLHLNSNYCKELFNVHNKWAFFKRIQLAKDNNLISYLPNDILNEILMRASASHKRLVNIKAHPGFWEAMNSGIERGMVEHEEVENRKTLTFNS